MSHRARHAKSSASAKAYARGAAVVGAAAIAAAGAGVIASGAASAATTAVSATTYVANHPDGGHGTPSTWSYDDMNRTLTITPADMTACTGAGLVPPAATDRCYTATVTDNGKFNAVVGAGTPNGTGGQISHAVQGTMTGSTDYVLYAPAADVPSASNVAKYEDDNYSSPTIGTSEWYLHAFASSQQADVKGTEGAYSWTYKDTCESWTDSSTNNDGQGAADGNITGKDVCVTSTTGPGYVVNKNSGKALDVTGGQFAAGTLLQQWTEGAKGPDGVAGSDQKFEIQTQNNGTSWLVTVHGGTTYYVTSSSQGDQLTLSTHPSSDAVLAKSGPYYEFTGTGLVMDVAGASTANGGKVIGYPLHDSTNQQWSLP